MENSKKDVGLLTCLSWSRMFRLGLYYIQGISAMDISTNME